MADPKLSKMLGVKVAAANIGEFVIVRNLDRGGQLTGAVKGTDRSVVFNPAKTIPNLQWQEQDLIQAEIRGRLQGVKQERIRKGGIDIQIDASTDTSTPGVSL